MKNILLILLVAGIVFMAGCSNSTEPDLVEEISGENVVLDVVARSFSASKVNIGDALTVTLTKTLDASQTNILIEENFPSDWTILDAGNGAVVGNIIRWAELTGASSGTYTYTVTVGGSIGTAALNGQYSIDGQTPVDIGGSTSVVVN